MQRGFKARAERLSVDAREDLSLAPHERLDPWAYATSLGVAVMGANELDLPEIVASQLLEKDPSSWSGLTLGHGKETLIILNSSHGGARQCSTLMHELSHVRLGHMPASVQLSTTGMLLLSDYSPEQEDEADWLMGALLLPRSALVFQRSKGKTREQIAEAYGVSEELCRWRIQMTGIEAQLRYRR